MNGLPQTLWSVHCVLNTLGAALASSLKQDRIAKVFQKGTDPEIDSYSGFFDNARRKATGLEDYLRSRGVDEVHILGLATDYCVKATALDARSLGFATRLITAGCRGVELAAGDCQRAIEEMRAAGVEIA